MITTDAFERDDIQGLVASGYVHLPRSAFALLTFDASDPRDARTWLRAIARTVTSASGRCERTSLNLALTFTGLQKLALPPATLSTFPVAFAEGMTSARRASILGDDSRVAAPWSWGGEHTPVDALLMVYGVTDDELAAFLARALADAAAHGLAHVVAPLEGRIHEDRNEHFGFADGIAQPVLASQRKHDPLARAGNVVRDGEFVLGYRNEYGAFANAPALGLDGSLGKNGTYLVFRQIEQDVAGLWNFIGSAAQNDPDTQELLAAKIVGRWRSGAPIVTYPGADPDPLELETATDDFVFRDDPHGFACPFGAHIRRANPRDGLRTSNDAAESLRRAARHRLLRRGRSYGARIADPRTADGIERGLHFIAICADIERQFEFVQQTWINNPVFGGLVGEVDPLVGDQSQGDAVMTIPGTLARVRVRGMTSFVTVRGGAYFFLPSLRALAWLGEP